MAPLTVYFLLLFRFVHRGPHALKRYGCLLSRPWVTALVAGVLVCVLLLPGTGLGAERTVDFLKEVRAEKDPAKRIQMLDKVLENPRLRGERLAMLLFERGMTHKEMGDCFRAIEDLSSALAHSRKIFSAWLEKAECLMRVDQPDEASRDVEYFLSIKPRDGRAYVVKGFIFEKQGFLSKAEDEYSRALHYESTLSEAVEARAKVRLKSGQPRMALEDADTLCTMTPRNPDAFMLRARIHVKLKEHDAALKDYGIVESLLHGDERVRREKVLVYFQTNRPEKALQTLAGESNGPSDDVEDLVLWARAHISLGNYREADKSLKRVLLKNPRHAAAHLYTGVVAMRRKLMDEALSYFNRAIRLDPKLVDAYKQRARTLMTLGEDVRAEEDLSTAVNLDPSDAELFSMRGITSMNRMLYDAAVKDFARALDNLPGDPRVLFDRAVAYSRRDDHESALGDLNRVVEIRPDSARARSFRGVTHFQLGHIAEAKDDLEEATRINPLDPQVWNNLGFFCYKTGHQRAAMDALNRALQIDPGYADARYNLKLVLKKEDTMSAPLPSPSTLNSHGVSRVNPTSMDGK